MPSSASVVCSELSFGWPDGDLVFPSLTSTFPIGRTGLVGVNGSGKSTLLRLIAGCLPPAGGSITVSGRLAYLPQDVTLDETTTVAEALGIAEIRRAIEQVVNGATAQPLYDVIGDDWDCEERAASVLSDLGLAGIELDRPIRQLSGGQTVLLALAARLVQRPDVLLLDEPTNNLDRDARGRLYQTVQDWRGNLIVVSHDRDLLDLMDQIGDLRSGTISWYGGNFTDYQATVAAEQETAERLVRAAEQDLRRQEQDLIETRMKLDRRARYGRKMSEQKREPKIVMGARKRAAQISAGKLRVEQEGKLADARQQLAESEQRLRDDRTIRIALPNTQLPNGRQVLELLEGRTRCSGPLQLRIRGPERIALTGPNGAGKTTLLETIAGVLPLAGGQLTTSVPMRYLPQRLDILDPDRTVAANVARYAPQASDNAIRAGLARFLFRGRRADQPAGQLSGGERFRASLAALLLAEPAPQLLLLDEPTNNLDLASVAELADALAAYRGALIVASHDFRFLAELGLTRWIELDGELTEHPVEAIAEAGTVDG